MRGIAAITASDPARPSRHESFLIYSRYRYLRLAVMLIAIAIGLFIADRPYGTHYGGSWAGYTLGIAGALLIVWLTWFGYRKRSYPEVSGRLVGRLSAHVYFGLALLVVATLHTGFHFGWNVHSLAYALMCVVIASGLVGAFCYVRYPELMTTNRAGMTMRQMLGGIATLDDQLRDAALPLDEKSARFIELAIETTAIGGSVWRQLTGKYPGCTTAAAIAHMDAEATVLAAAPQELSEKSELEDSLGKSDSEDSTDKSEPEESLKNSIEQVRGLLDDKMALLVRVRRDVRYKAIMDLWLYVHVPLSIMLLAALFAHIIAVFFLW